MSSGSDDLAAKAKEAANLFKSLQYEQALAILQALQKKKPDDPKVKHNIAVVEYYRDGHTDPQKLLKALAEVKGACETLASAAEEKLEQITPNSSNGSTQSPATSPSGSSGGAGFNVTYMEDYDPSLATLNTAVILYHLHHRAAAAALLEPLFRNVEPLDEALAMTICLLLLDIWLEARKPEQAAGVLAYLEKAFGYLLEKSGDEGSTTTGNAGSGARGGDNIAMDRVAEGGSEMLSSLGGSVPETAEGTAEGLQGNPVRHEKGQAGSSRTASIEDKNLPVPAQEFRLWLHLYKARLHLLTRNMKNAKREVKNALTGVGSSLGPPSASQNVIPSSQQLSLPERHALFLKAQMEYSRHNYRKAIKLLFGVGGSPNETPHTRTKFLSNMGCIHHKLGKHHMAALYFSQALGSATAARAQAKQNSNKLPLPAFSSDQRLPIVYNVALQHLLCGKYALAVQCFHEAAKQYHNQPTLWLRLAECCVGAYLQSELSGGKMQGRSPHRTGFTINSTTSGANSTGSNREGGSGGTQAGVGEGSVGGGGAGGGSASVVIGTHGHDELAQVVGAPHWRRLLMAVTGIEAGSTPETWTGLGMGTGSEPAPEGSAMAIANAIRNMSLNEREGAKVEAAKGAAGVLLGSCLQGGGGVVSAGVGAENRARQGLLSLEYAAMCLRNAVVLLERAEAASEARSGSATGTAFQQQSSVTNTPAGTPSQDGGEPAATPTAGAGAKLGGLKGSASGAVVGSGAASAPEGSGKADGKEGSKPAGATMASIAAFEEETKREASLVRQAVLANISHLWLLCDHPLGALHAAEALLKVEGCTKESTFLSHTYAAEALCLLDRPQEAAEHLTASIMEHSEDGNVSQGTAAVGSDQGSGDKDKEEESGTAQSVPPPNASEVAALTGAAARAALYVNLAAVYATKDEFQQAQQCALQALSIAPTSSQALLSLVFVELSQGHTDVALSLLKQRRHTPAVVQVQHAAHATPVM